jgi:polygalacturonase
MKHISKLKNKIGTVRVSIILGVFYTFSSISSFAREINILTFGATSDTLTLNTQIIQSAIDQLYNEGGGTVVIPAGKFLTGTLYLKDNVELNLEQGSILFGSTNPIDYPENELKVKSGTGKALIYANGQRNISVTGKGTINGMGNSPVWLLGDNASGRPKVIYFVDCRNVMVDGITLTNSAFWVSDFLACDYVIINGVKIYSYGNHNNDGIDIDSKNVVVSNCIIESDDDALCFKSHIYDRPCENVAVTNCILASNCNGIKFGTASHGGFKNISVTNCIIKRPVEDNLRLWYKNIEGIDSGHTVISGIALEMVDGGIMDHIKISDIIMEGIQTPIFIKLGNRKRYNDSPGQLKNIQINNIIARNASLISSSITGYPGHNIQNVDISNIDITYKGGGTEKHYQYVVPENEKGYPENRMFGHYLPAYGFFIRHVEGLKMQNINLSLSRPDARSVIRMDDVSDIKISNFKADNPSSNVPIIEIIEGKDILISESYGWKKHPVFISISENSKNIKLINNDFSNFEKITEKDSHARIKLISNIHK